MMTLIYYTYLYSKRLYLATLLKPFLKYKGCPFFLPIEPVYPGLQNKDPHSAPEKKVRSGFLFLKKLLDIKVSGPTVTVKTVIVNYMQMC